MKENIVGGEYLPGMPALVLASDEVHPDEEMVVYTPLSDNTAQIVWDMPLSDAVAKNMISIEEAAELPRYTRTQARGYLGIIANY
jgi:hypothetical protein